MHSELMASFLPFECNKDTFTFNHTLLQSSHGAFCKVKACEHKASETIEIHCSMWPENKLDKLFLVSFYIYLYSLCVSALRLCTPHLATHANACSVFYIYGIITHFKPFDLGLGPKCVSVWVLLVILLWWFINGVDSTLLSTRPLAPGGNQK